MKMKERVLVKFLMIFCLCMSGCQNVKESDMAPTSVENQTPIEMPTLTPSVAHTHSWQEATCTSTKKCSTCGVSEGSALGHNYDSDTDLNCNVCNYVRGYWSDYDDWSAWQDTEVEGNLCREVETQEVVAGYNKKTQWKYSRYYDSTKRYAYGSYSGDCIYYEETEWLDNPLPENMEAYGYKGIGFGYTSSGTTGGAKIFWYNKQTREVEDLSSPIYKTQYRYRDRRVIYY